LKTDYIRHHGGNIWHHRGVIDFSANINPEGLSDAVLSTISHNLHLLVHYPDPDCTELTRVFCQKYNLQSEYCLWGNGAAELFYLLFNYLKPGTVHLPVPSFCEYEGAALATSAIPRFWPFDKNNNWDINWFEIIAKANKGDLLVITNPNNPTGFLWKRTDLIPVIEEAARKGIHVLIDEAFIDFINEPDEASFRSDFLKWPNLFICYSLTKFYAIPGLRLGVLLANSETVQELKFLKDPWNVNLLAQLAGIAALQDIEYETRSRIIAQKRKQLMIELITTNLLPLGVNFWRPAANFILMELPVSVKRVEAILNTSGFLIRNCQNFRGLNEYYCRLAIRNEEDNKKLIQVLRQAIIEVKRDENSSG